MGARARGAHGRGHGALGFGPDVTRRPNLKILFMTGYAESAASSEFLGKDMEIISKPFTMDKLAGKIREIVERQ